MRSALGILLAVLLILPAIAQTGPSYEVVSYGPTGLEMRFHGLPMRNVRADDNQNALMIAFQQPVDGALFDQLPGALPQWISMAYVNYDNGIIMSSRPVTFLAHPESDGFSLRILARDTAPIMSEPPKIRGSE